MARSTSSQTPHASQTLATGAGDLQSSWLAINYGVSGAAKVYAASLPTGGLNFYIEGAQDSSGTGAMEIRRVQMVPTATGSGNAVYVPFALAPGGLDGDWTYYRCSFTAPTGNNATVEVQAMTTTGF